MAGLNEGGAPAGVAGQVPSGAADANIPTGNPGEGSTSWTLVAAGAAMVLAGAGLIVGMRRRRS